jgi:hemolysin activation/secretion protein
MPFPTALRFAGLVLLSLPAAMAQPAPQPTTVQAEAARFDVLEFEVQGNTVLGARSVEAALLPFMGEQRTLADVDAARAALEKAYQEAGYLTVFVDLPEQRVADGLVRLNVTEGRIERVRVTGSRYYAQGFIRDAAAVLQDGAVPNFNTLQTQLAELNRTADRQVQPVLRPGREPGTVEVELKVRDRLPLSGSVELNNKASAGSEPLRLMASMRYDNLMQRDQSLALTFITAPQARQESQVLVGNWTSPLAGQASLVTSLVLSDSRLQPLGTSVLGQGFTLGLRWARPFFGAQSVHTVSLGFEYRDLKQRVVNGSDEVSTPLRYLPLQAIHSALWMHDAGASTTLNSALTFGLRGLLERRIDCPGTTADGQQDQFACNRDGADGGFVTLRGDLRHSQPLAGGQLVWRTAWQLAMQPLVSGEQFTVGGADSVRGYHEAEATGDLALLGSLEWRTPNLAARAASALPEGWAAAGGAGSELTLSAFADAAQARTLDPLPGQAARVWLVGSGLGLRLRSGPMFSADLDLAWPHKASVNTAARRPRLHARLGLQF